MEEVKKLLAKKMQETTVSDALILNAANTVVTIMTTLIMGKIFLRRSPRSQ